MPDAESWQAPSPRLWPRISPPWEGGGPPQPGGERGLQGGATQLSHHAAHVPLFGTPTPLTQPPCARVLFFLSVFLGFLLSSLLFFFFGSFFFFFSLVSFFASFVQSKSRFCRFDVTDFVQSGKLNYLVFNTLKIAHVTKMSNRKYKSVKSIVRFWSIVTFQKKVGYQK